MTTHKLYVCDRCKHESVDDNLGFRAIRVIVQEMGGPDEESRQDWCGECWRKFGRDVLVRAVEVEFKRNAEKQV